MRAVLPVPPKINAEQANLAASMGIDPSTLVAVEGERPPVDVWPELDSVLRLYAAADSQRRSNGAVDFRVLPLVARIVRFGPITGAVLADVRVMDSAMRGDLGL